MGIQRPSLPSPLREFDGCDANLQRVKDIPPPKSQQETPFQISELLLLLSHAAMPPKLVPRAPELRTRPQPERRDLVLKGSPCANVSAERNEWCKEVGTKSCAGCRLVESLVASSIAVASGLVHGPRGTDLGANHHGLPCSSHHWKANLYRTTLPEAFWAGCSSAWTQDVSVQSPRCRNSSTPSDRFPLQSTV